MFEAIVSPQEDKFVAVRPGCSEALQLPSRFYALLGDVADQGGDVPDWFADAAEQAWAGVAFRSRPIRETLLVRPPSTQPVTYSRASWEINLGCNFACEHCYLPERPFAGMSRDAKLTMIDTLRDMGVLYFKITGGEPLIDPDFIPAYERAYDAGMMIEILTNGSRLARPELIDLFTNRPPHKITVSIYGATPESTEALTRNKTAFTMTLRGLQAAKAARLPIEVTILVTKHNEHEVQDMKSLADELSDSHRIVGSLSPTWRGERGPLDAQAGAYIGKTDAFAGCPAGHTSFAVDPHGMVTMCQVGRDNPINLLVEGPAGLLRLPGIADAQMLRTGGCTGCKLSSTCRVCRPMARVYQEAKAPLGHYCQHGMKEKS
ncbi:radical SAM protein [Actinoplanes regularis]|uniref:Radical SAM superfamily enzyme, MoaA/NifB/PqqE/SkfB family n=1 Tax=Actinoplanes regularis TaxID=52697 RepID=A0A238XGI4_9ACTN|nr:radical SAM protein [Actinoplanes regularis]GIE86777.1 hypothetical protein Are01nite_32570 [Actinoplanes regularis]SNR57718.1 Radical SAM superfamily enzyme, MoaA/NifB/PqqE/SkfB family [Actinoplanes regularis]